MSRITESMLQSRIDRLNKLTNSPMTYRTGDTINVGHFHLDGSYGGVCLHRTCNTSVGVSDVLSTGHIPKRELFAVLCAFISGIEFSKE